MEKTGGWGGKEGIGFGEKGEPRGRHLAFKHHALIRRRDGCKIGDEVLESCHRHAALDVHVKLGAGSEFESDFDHCGHRCDRVDGGQCARICI